MLAEDGKKNSLGRAPEVVETVLRDHSRLEELYQTISHEDAWVRMRAIDAFEKVCRRQPGWIVPYVDRIQSDLALSTQPSIQWHVAELYMQLELTDKQKREAIQWLKDRVETTEVDWIVASNTLSALAYFVKKGDVSEPIFRSLAEVQLGHASQAVRRRAQRLLDAL